MTLTESAVRCDTNSVAHRERRGGMAMILGVVVLIVALLVAGILPRLSRAKQLAAATRSSSAQPIVTVAYARRGDSTQALTVPGTLYGLHETALYARTSGYVKRWLVDMGSRVKAGQAMAEIETPELDQELAQSKSTLAQMQATAELTRTTLDRWRNLIQQNVATRQELDEKQGAYDAARASASAAASNVERLTALKHFGGILAPFAGVVTARNVDVGALVVPGGNANVRPLFTLAQTDSLRVIANVPQNAAPSVRVGQVAEILVQELGATAFIGRVTRTSNALDPSTRTLLTEIQLANSTGRLLPGMYAQVKLVLQRVTRPMLIPTNTLMLRADGPHIAVVVDGRVRIVRVTLGRDYGTEVEVASGLPTDAVLIVNPGDDIVEGTAVTIAVPTSAH